MEMSLSLWSVTDLYGRCPKAGPLFGGKASFKMGANAEEDEQLGRSGIVRSFL